jgi:predicted O-methyltransferase YrrM
MSKFRRLLSHPGQVVRSRSIRALFPVLKVHNSVQRLALWSLGNAPRVALERLFPGVDDIDLALIGPFKRTVETLLDLTEVAAIAAIMKSVKARRIVEVGTCDGNTTVNIAANSPDDAVITTIELPRDWNGAYKMPVNADDANVTDRDQIGGRILRSPYRHKIVQVFADSAALDWSKLGGPFDAIFIDGCHSYSYVKSDTDNALANLTPQGLIVWHDYGYMADLTRAVDEYAQSLDVSVIQGTRLAVARRRKTAH